MGSNFKDVFKINPFKDYIAEFGRYKKAERILTFTPLGQTNNEFAIFYGQFKSVYKGPASILYTSEADRINDKLTKLNPDVQPINVFLDSISLRFQAKEREIETNASHTKAFWWVGAPIGVCSGFFAHRLFRKLGKVGLLMTTALAFGIAHLVAYYTRGCFNISNELQISEGQAISAATDVQSTVSFAIKSTLDAEGYAKIYNAHFAASVELALALPKQDSFSQSITIRRQSLEQELSLTS